MQKCSFLPNSWAEPKFNYYHNIIHVQDKSVQNQNVSLPYSEFLSQVNYDTLSCIGVCDASAFLTTTNGSFPFIYNWDNNSQNNDTAFNLCYGYEKLAFIIRVILLS